MVILDHLITATAVFWASMAVYHYFLKRRITRRANQAAKEGNASQTDE